MLYVLWKRAVFGKNYDTSNAMLFSYNSTKSMNVVTLQVNLYLLETTEVLFSFVYWSLLLSRCSYRVLTLLDTADQCLLTWYLKLEFERTLIYGRSYGFCFECFFAPKNHFFSLKNKTPKRFFQLTGTPVHFNNSAMTELVSPQRHPKKTLMSLRKIDFKAAF